VLLRSTVSLPLAVSSAAWLALVVIVGIHLITGDAASAWQEWLEKVVVPAMQQSGMALEEAPSQEVLALTAQFMTGLLLAIVMLSVTGCLILARWWQALLYNPGGFREEFHALRLGKPSALLLGAVVLLGMFTEGGLRAMALDALPVTLLVFLFPGLGLMHAVVARTGIHVGWLVAMYVLLLLVTPQLMLLAIIMVAFMDTWLNFRRYLKRPAG
jgi:hypothetical protein